MRFPVSLPPIVTPGEDLRDIQPVTALTVVRRVADRARPTIVRVGFGRNRGVLQQRIYGEESAPVRGSKTDRRKMCRRIYHTPVMLDTRSGKDRRQGSRREEEPAMHIVIEA